MAEVFNKFINIVPNLKIPTNHNYDTDFLVTNDQVANALNKFRNHPSIIMIKNYGKQNSDYFAGYFCGNISQCISKSMFPRDLKLADVTPVYKNKSKNSKDNYRPVSILSNISKIYERCLYDQIQVFFESILSKYHCEFRRGYNSQHCLMTLIEKWKKSVDNGGAFGALFTDLSKAFNCLSHELLIAKLDAYGFDKNVLKLVNSYLSNRKQS